MVRHRDSQTEIDSKKERKADGERELVINGAAVTEIY